MVPALYYSAESYSTKGSKLMGRQAAGEAFLRALLRAFPNEPVHALLHSPKDAALIDKELAGFGHTAGIHKHHLSSLEAMTASMLYLPSPGIDEIAWHRLKMGDRSFSLCGVTHTTATHRVMETIANLPLAPIRPWDALICTSRSVRNTVQRIIEQQFDYLRWKLGATRLELPQLPVIPLGVHCDDYQFSKNQQQKARQLLGVADNDIVLLFVGRLSFHAKAHPHPMLAALQRVVEKGVGDRKLHLVQCGWYANQAIEDAFNESQQVLAPSVVHHYLDGREAENRLTAWASADIFISLSDNIQETFGLTPIEAMAAGIPSVVSDWDGYKDTIDHGVSGFRVKTVMPAAGGESGEIAQRYNLGEDTYDMYCGQTCQYIGVDVQQTADAVYQLVTDENLRKTMGENAKKRSQRIFSWDVVMDKYIELWRQLEHLRHSHSDSFGVNPIKQSPSRMDPFDLFDDYPSVIANDHSEFLLTSPLNEEDYQRFVSLATFRYAKRVIPSWQQVKLVQTSMGSKKQSFEDISSQCKAALETSTLSETLCWLVKVGAVSI